MWQSQVENEHYSTVSGLVISLEHFIEVNFRATATGSL